MNRLLTLLPEATGEEMAQVQQLTKNLSEEELNAFCNIYRARRKDPQMILIMSLVGLFFLPGLQRFFLDQIGMGVLYLFTLGLCIIGSILDIVNYKSMTNEYNMKKAQEVLGMVNASK